MAKRHYTWWTAEDGRRVPLDELPDMELARALERVGRECEMKMKAHPELAGRPADELFPNYGDLTEEARRRALAYHVTEGVVTSCISKGPQYKDAHSARFDSPEPTLSILLGGRQPSTSVRVRPSFVVWQGGRR